MGKSIKTSISIDGEQGYKNALKSIKSEHAVLNSEMRLAKEIYKNNADSIEALTSKQSILTKQIAEQNKAVDEAKSHLEKLKSEFGENSEQVRNFEKEVNNQLTSLAKLENELEKTEKGLDGLGKETSKTSRAFEVMAKSVGKSAELITKGIMAVGTVVTASIGAFGKFALDGAMELEGTQAKFDTVFNGFEEQALGFVDELQKLTPVTQAQGQAMASSLQDLLIPMGLSRDTATELTGETMHLVGALTNFNSATVTAEEVNAKFASALTGSYEGLKSLGIQLNKEMVDAYANANGVSEAEAIVALAYQQSGDALAGYTEESLDSLTKTALFKTSLQDTASEIGIGLLPTLNLLLEGMQAITEDVLPYFTDGINGLVGMFTNADGASEQFANGIGGIVDKLSEIIPTVLEKGVEIVTAVVTGVASALPTLIEGVTELVPTIASSILMLLPMLLEVGMSVILNLTEGVLSALPEVIPVMIDVVASMVEVLTEQVPLIIETGITLLVALVEALPDIIAKIVEVLPQIIDSIITTLLDAIPLIVESGIMLLVALVEALPDIITQIVEVIPQIIYSVCVALINASPQLDEAGFKLFVALIKNIPQIIIAILKIVPMIIESLLGAFTSRTNDMMEIGKNMVEGIWQGISNMKAYFTNKVKTFFGDIVTTVKGVFQIQSPSKVFEKEIGEMLVLGMVNGIDKNKGKAKKSAEDMAKETYTTAKTWINNYKNDTDYLVSEEIKMWETLAKTYTKVSNEKIEIDKNIAKLKAQQEKENFEVSKKWIEQRKGQNELSLSDEVKAWERVQNRYLEGTDERKQADKLLFEAKKELAKKEEELQNKLIDAESKYNNELDKRTEKIRDSFGLFDELTEREEVSGKKLKDNLKGQVEEMQDWANNIKELSSKGLDEGLIKEFESMGVKANAELKAFNKMTEKELTEYNELWLEKNELAKEIAIKELEELREATNKEIQGINDELLQVKGISLADKETGEIIPKTVASEQMNEFNEIVEKGYTSTIEVTEEKTSDITKIITKFVDKLDVIFNQLPNKMYMYGKNAFGSFRKAVEEELTDIMSYVQREIDRMERMLSFGGNNTVGSAVSAISGQVQSLQNAYSNSVTTNNNVTSASNVTNNITLSTPVTIGTFASNSKNDLRKLSSELQKNSNKNYLALGGSIL